MKIVCQNAECGHNFNIPDEKIPDRPIKVACPKCKQPNPVQKPSASAAAQPESRPEETLAVGPATGGGYDRVMAEVDRKIATLRSELLARGAAAGGAAFAPAAAGAPAPIAMPGESGIKKALICDDDKLIREMIRDTVSSLGYEVEEAPTLKESLAVFDRPEMEYDLILIDKVFPDDPEGGFQILSKIATLSIAVRRGIFVVFISGDIKSRDASSAFLMGANTVVNKSDISKLKPILREEIGNYERLYQAFNRCLGMAKAQKF